MRGVEQERLGSIRRRDDRFRRSRDLHGPVGPVAGERLEREQCRTRMHHGDGRREWRAERDGRLASPAQEVDAAAREEHDEHRCDEDRHHGAPLPAVPTWNGATPGGSSGGGSGTGPNASGFGGASRGGGVAMVPAPERVPRPSRARRNREPVSAIRRWDRNRASRGPDLRPPWCPTLTEARSRRSAIFRSLQPRVEAARPQPGGGGGGVAAADGGTTGAAGVNETVGAWRSASATWKNANGWKCMICP